MQRALALAGAAVGLTEPNPRVGCVLVAPDGRWIGEGHTQAAGSAHAEVMAMRDAQAQGHPVSGATAYVTLEPCSHHGRTPPCCDALVAAGVARVVVALVDPNPAVSGRGIARLRAAGIQVDFADVAAAEASRELNIGFLSRMQRGRPWVRMKIAASLDGRTALDNGASQWITGEAARHDGHAWRKRASALLTGSGTVLADDPRLDVRGHTIARQPWRIVLDSHLATPARARLFEATAPLLFVTAEPDAERRQALQDRGAEILTCPNADKQVNLDALMVELTRREMNEIHVEAGARLNAALLQAGWVDELLIYQAPMLVGAGRGMAALGPSTALAQAQRFAFHRVDRIGDDLRLLLRRPATTPAV
ncbi:MAG TPA: bifunctional diaminohydroxyphosphoribosylaminopyrimidine deaminase/5-amino-6-(5-phosphoribosylamino)uracil reductase RibD [Ideonella sp.]|uniref:bifunctional diaminohydroxyphosphoribosylaminopyrimidine deaminase/5-amino-6-(5-phosphoribosylamino)uracil reductase RibD n=1 Tax=Ideonella sp. TaxID=1929293 RepID=UPI002E32C99D|nr:bifunctional diaminohydroxyphosphoribosylaminopyrimidine deaminase/5-amino-6-(5-phosphoribosylamino)uracil reductase RibD [Ideonella sp.]HEX5686459.1 bifunctional diaminohydroxyphosphoribosylaminopyrimidine deaminase/5-amino-6-(5-phosphoribosylamino)uracil reductase RibD [Ideonella sp.]